MKLLTWRFPGFLLLLLFFNKDDTSALSLQSRELLPSENVSPVIELKQRSDLLALLEGNVKSGDLQFAVVLFHAEGCFHCTEYAVTFRSLADVLSCHSKTLKFFTFECCMDDGRRAECLAQKVGWFPTVQVFYKNVDNEITSVEIPQVKTAQELRNVELTAPLTPLFPSTTPECPCQLSAGNALASSEHEATSKNMRNRLERPWKKAYNISHIEILHDALLGLMFMLRNRQRPLPHSEGASVSAEKYISGLTDFIGLAEISLPGETNRRDLKALRNKLLEVSASDVGSAEKLANVSDITANIHIGQVSSGEPSVFCTLVTCNMWMLFHLMSVGLAAEAGNRDNVLPSVPDAMEIMRSSISESLSCSSCKRHFDESYAASKFGLRDVKDFKGLALWLWRLHNCISRVHEVALRESEGVSKSTQVDRDVRFPPLEICGSCKKSKNALLAEGVGVGKGRKYDDSDDIRDYDLDVVFKFLNDYYLGQ